ncbi:hypothetical protein AB0D38_39640, partial [Streptomyces sp. NPDC048279]
MRTVERWLTSPWRRSCVAALAGALPVLAFPAPSLWWFAHVALVPWLLLARSAPTGRRAAYDGWSGEQPELHRRHQPHIHTAKPVA